MQYGQVPVDKRPRTPEPRVNVTEDRRADRPQPLDFGLDVLNEEIEMGSVLGCLAFRHLLDGEVMQAASVRRCEQRAKRRFLGGAASLRVAKGSSPELDHDVEV